MTDNKETRCTCGKEMSYKDSYRCRLCHFHYCECCALEHFSLYEDQKGHVKPRNIFKSFWWIIKKKFKK